MTIDRRTFAPDQVVQVNGGAEEFAGLWMIIKHVGDEYLTGLILIDGEDPVLARVPRMWVDSAIRAFLRDPNQ